MYTPNILALGVLVSKTNLFISYITLWNIKWPLGVSFDAGAMILKQTC